MDRFEKENGGQLLVAALCLLETSATGLLETELLKILGDEETLLPKDKGEKEGKGILDKKKLSIPSLHSVNIENRLMRCYWDKLKLQNYNIWSGM